MWYPGYGINQDFKKMLLMCIDDPDVKKEFAKQINIEIENSKKRYNGQVQSYESLTSGNVNMQAKMAVSGYDVYGRTIMKSLKDSSNTNTYKKMKNQIKYGRSPEKGYQNRGGFTLT